MMTFLCTRSGRRASGVECRIAAERAYFRVRGLPVANMIGWWPRLCPVMSLALLWACSVGAGSDCKSVAIETDSRIAEQTQQRHLQALFDKYGQNGSISLEGLFNLLKGVGLDRIRKVMVHHPGNAHNHTHTHDHTHTHVDKLTAHTHPVTTKKGDMDHSVEKSDPVPKAQPDPASGKKSQSDAHHNLYMKMNQESTTALTTPSYVTRSRRTNRSADYDFTQDHASFSPSQPNVTHSNHTHHDEDTPTHQHDDHDEHEHARASLGCQNASTILQTHGMRKEASLSVKDFSFLCPALLMQIDSKSCIVHEDEDEHSDHSHHHKHHHHHHDHQHLQHPHNHTNGRGQRNTPVYIAWLGGFLSITLISLLALVGVVLIPLMNRVCFNFLLSFLVALAVGTLSGDALLHLIPHSQGHHHHGHSEEHAEEEDSLRPVWTGLTALSGVYIMFLIEHFLTLGKMYKDKNQKVQKRVDLTTEVLESEKLPSLEENDVKIEAAETNGGRALAEEEEVMLGAELYNDIDCENKCHSHFHDTVGQSDEQHHHHHDYHHILHHHHSQNHHPHTHTHRHTHSYSQQHFEQAGVATLAWMVIMGDGLHNFSDGLAIGAAFTEGLSSGLSTSVAVFCHELPHELGDFAVLLKAGMSVRQAMLYNLLSALMGYLGMIIGILIGHYAENVATWIFALTAGLFMYVALVDMVPEMLHNDASEAGFSHYGFFLLQNAGILLGFGIMLIIAVFEDRIQLDLGY
ncbi:zinc transporter ZIP6 [Danio rerio]|uniref:Zinc transporter ZIP6 n=1 Tax=Danio rerio TaxID=7955 RepID=S39A6_DANRE|nr:zinc transporter ZIP6 [Danio rerio]Q6L8F3.1 RecName: Full=Zinc transporter ZIP6; AltName: Full=Estrogen-regulated protein LIV-1; AltName: Full=Solute carrier family 39 member 6; AltName: Full=Zrt- and Irt-like protein 6; Short=ZIP-6 [Danio rerio]BAD18961.1 zinc transporter LIV1 [Danio rerio]|eukprot:NP_001001591.1 zinc transporter ZIP6 [Danio rerio]